MPTMGVSGEVLGAAAIGGLVGAAAAAYHLLTDCGASEAPSTAPAPVPPACPGEGECGTRAVQPDAPFLYGADIVDVALLMSTLAPLISTATNSPPMTMQPHSTA